jgi:CRP/FNR family transcriptional regulator
MEPSAHDLRHVPLFAGLPGRTLDDLARAGLTRAYRDGHILCSEGDPGDMLYVLESGEVRVSRITTDGHEIVLAVVEAPAALGELSLIDGAPRAATITAQGPVRVRLIPRAAFTHLLHEQPAMRDAILHRLAEMLRRTNELHVDVLTLDVPGRLAKWLLERAERHGQHTPEGIAVSLGRTQSELAAELGTTRSTLNRALNSFADLGLIALEGDLVRVVRRERLADYTR